MLKNYFLLSLIVMLLLLFSGCQTRMVDVEQLTDYKGVYFEKGQGVPYTGHGVGLYPNGEKELEISLVDGLPDGTWSTWQKDGTLIREFVYEEGQLVKFATFYANGNKFLYAEYKNGKTHGKNIFWRKDGTKKFDVEFLDGKKHGKEFHWHPNGQLAKEAEYSRGKKIKATYWDEDGKVIKQEGME